jgi:hypothetical protein
MVFREGRGLAALPAPAARITCALRKAAQGRNARRYARRTIDGVPGNCIRCS